MPRTEEVIVTIKAFKELAAEKPLRQKRVYGTIRYGSITPAVRIEPKELDDLIETLIRVKGENVTPADVGLPCFATVHRITTARLKPETIIFLRTSP